MSKTKTKARSRNKLRNLLLCVALGACTQTSSSNHTQNKKQEEQSRKSDSPAKTKEQPSVELQLIHSSGTLLAESTIEIAAKIVIEPGWHIYWESPGDSGLPTSLNIEPPPGFRVDKVRFPGPKRFMSPGPSYSFGYADHAVLFTNLKSPRKIIDGSGHFRAELKWLACKTVCIRGKSQADLEIKRASPPTEDPMVERFRAKLPTLLPSSLAKIDVNLTTTYRNVDIQLNTGSIDDFFPLTNEHFYLDQIHADEQRLSLRYNIPARSDRTFGGRLGVLAVRDSQREVGYYEVRVDSSVPHPSSQPRK